MSEQPASASAETTTPSPAPEGGAYSAGIEGITEAAADLVGRRDAEQAAQPSPEEQAGAREKLQARQSQREADTDYVRRLNAFASALSRELTSLVPSYRLAREER